MEARDKMADSVENFVNTIMGQGKDLEDWLKKNHGNVLKVGLPA